jgi:hypothetical protein
MSAGHRHRRANPLSHTRELHKLLQIGGAPSLMKQWVKIEANGDCPYLCGYNVAGNTRFADREFARALHDPAFAEQLLGEAIDTGLSPQDTLQCLLTHEAIEKVLLDADNPIEEYLDAHEFATAGEHELVLQKGSTPHRYERGLERAIAYCQRKPLKIVDRDYACAPALDEPDANDRRIIRDLRRLGVMDAFKADKKDVDYGKSRSSTDQCADCSMWEDPRGGALSRCSLVNGLVRNDRVCDRFEPRGGNESQNQGPQDQPPQPQQGGPAGEPAGPSLR